jgi:hypothetical protein
VVAAIPVEEIMLCYATLGAEELEGFFMQGWARGNFAFLGKVEFMHEAENPNVEGKGIEAVSGVEEDAVGDFFTDSG